MHRFKVKGWKKSFHAHSNHKRTGVATLISNATDFKFLKKKKKKTTATDKRGL